jgi:hypothetical protein
MPLTRQLLEVLVTEYSLLRAAPLLLCGSSATVGQTSESRCAASVAGSVPLVVLAATLGLLCLRAAALGRLDWVVPRVQTGALMNRQ